MLRKVSLIACLLLFCFSTVQAQELDSFEYNGCEIGFIDFGDGSVGYEQFNFIENSNPQECQGNNYTCDCANGTGICHAKKSSQCSVCANSPSAHCDGCCAYHCKTPACKTRCCANQCGTIC